MEGLLFINELKKVLAFITLRSKNQPESGWSGTNRVTVSSKIVQTPDSYHIRMAGGRHQGLSKAGPPA